MNQEERILHTQLPGSHGAHLNATQDLMLPYLGEIELLWWIVLFSVGVYMLISMLVRYIRK
jgi:hypothetical protein